MKILKKFFLIFCVAGVLTENLTLTAWAEPKTPETMSQTEPQTSEVMSESEVIELEIDDDNRYIGMDKSYSDGYMPKIEKDTAYLVVPVVCQGTLKDSKVKTLLNLGNGTSLPFVSAVYEKDVALSQEKINDCEETVACYLVTFDLKLKSDRKNGDYPVVLSVQAEDSDGNPVYKEFSVKVVINDEKPPTTEPMTEEPATSKPATEEPSGEEPANDNPSDEPGVVDVIGPSDGGDNGGGSFGGSSGGSGGSSGGGSASDGPTFAPKMIVQSCRSSKDEIQAGDEVTLDVTLLNTSSTENIRNMTVTIGDEGEYMNLLSPTDTIYVDAVSAGQTCVVSYKYKVMASAVPGAYGLSVSMDYADSKGATQSASGKIKMMVTQAVKLEFDPLMLGSEVQVGDVVTAQVQAMNLGRGKVHNVRAVIEADGLIPEGTMFIGDIEAGQTATGSVKISVTSLSEGSSLYGKTKGTVTYYYEEESGKEYEETADFITNIQTPFSDTAKEVPEDTGQWWIAMAVIGGILALFVIGMVFREIRRKNQKDEAEEGTE